MAVGSTQGTLSSGQSPSKGARRPGKAATEESVMEATWSRWHWRKNWVEKDLAETGERQQASQEAVQRRSSDGPSSGSDSAPQTTWAREGTFTISPAVRIPVLQTE